MMIIFHIFYWILLGFLLPCNDFSVLSCSLAHLYLYLIFLLYLKSCSIHILENDLNAMPCIYLLYVLNQILHDLVEILSHQLFPCFIQKCGKFILYLINLLVDSTICNLILLFSFYLLNQIHQFIEHYSFLNLFRYFHFHSFNFLNLLEYHPFIQNLSFFQIF